MHAVALLDSSLTLRMTNWVVPEPARNLPSAKRPAHLGPNLQETEMLPSRSGAEWRA